VRNKAPDIAVLVLNHNGIRFLPPCYESILRNDRPAFDLVMIDNASTDGSVEMTLQRFPMVKVIRHDTNMGYSAAYDEAIRALDYPFMVLLNNDTIVEPNWLWELFMASVHEENVAACGSRILLMDRETVDHGGGLFTLIGSGVDVGKWTRAPVQSAIPWETGYGCGCSLLIRRKAYIDVGGFDRGYGYYHEDVDLCWRFRLSGYSVLHVPRSVVYHHLGGGRRLHIDENPWKVYHCEKNRLVNVIKNTGPLRLGAALLLSLAYDAVRVKRFVTTGRRDLLTALGKGCVTVLGDLGGTLRKRRQAQNHRACSERIMGSFFLPVRASLREYRRLLQVHQRQD
jgi:hypothetical protein